MNYSNRGNQVVVKSFDQNPTTSMIKDLCIPVLKGLTSEKELKPNLVKNRFGFSKKESKNIVDASKKFFKTNRTGINKSIYYSELQNISDRIVQCSF